MLARGTLSTNNRRGMTLVEVLAVVVILGLLAATLAVGFSGALGKGKHELAKTGIAQIIGKLEIYRLEHGAWPTTTVGLAALSDGQASPSAPYYLPPDSIIDPWGNAYVIIIPGPNEHPYEVLSYGADAAPGGEGENADVTSLALRGDS